MNLVGVCTHFASSEEPENPLTEKQEEKFSLALRMIKDFGFNPPDIHAACSAAALTNANTRHSLARTGLALYGLYPSTQIKEKYPRELWPVLSWKTLVAQVKKIPKGTAIGYGHTETVTRDTVVAVLPVGYYDGIDRKLSSRGVVLIRGKRAKILGRVCMNICVVDATDISEVAKDDEVVLIGRQGDNEVSADEWAALSGTINYEIVTRIGAHIPRVVV